MSNERRIMLGRNELVRFSYAKVFEPDTFMGQGEPKYSVSILIDKNDKVSLSALQKAYSAAIEQGKEKYGPSFKVPTKILGQRLHDGDDKGDPAYEGCYYINAKNKRKPAIIDKNKQPIIDDPDTFYSGCLGRVIVELYAYGGNSKGIAISLGNIMKVADGERFGGGSSSADEDFKEFEAGFDDDEDTNLF